MKMKNYSIIASIIFAISVVNALADGSDEIYDACSIKKNLHKDFANILTNDIGIQVFNELRQTVKNICMDEKAHNGIVSVLDGIMETVTDPHVSEVVGAVFYWTEMLVNNENFQNIWDENLNGLNMWFDNKEIVLQLTDTFFDRLTELLNSPYFDSTFEQVVKNMANMMNLGRNAMFNTGALVSRPIRTRRLPSLRNRL